MPVSCTLHCNTTVPELSDDFGFTDTAIVTPPCFVNLIAFPTRLNRICRNLIGSPLNSTGTSASMFTETVRPFEEANPSANVVMSQINARRLTSATSRVILPASIFEKSRMSFTSVNNASAERCMVSISCRCWSVSDVSLRSCVHPSTPFIGVRSSWLIVARKIPFARADSSAASFARRKATSEVISSP